MRRKKGAIYDNERVRRGRRLEKGEEGKGKRGWGREERMGRGREDGKEKRQ